MKNTINNTQSEREKSEIPIKLMSYTMEEPKLDDATFHFSQEGNYEDGESVEFIEIQCKASLGIDNEEGCFYVIKTEQWSFDSLDELQKLIDRISKALNK